MTYCWFKGNRHFGGLKRGTKLGSAHDLIVMGNIHLNKQDLARLDLRDGSLQQLERMEFHEFSWILEQKGWRWEKE